MARKGKKKARKVGSSWYTMRKVGKTRRRVKVTKISRTKYRVRVVSKKKRRGRRKRRR